MRIGLQVPNFTWAGGSSELGATFGAIAERAERAGFYSLWVMDHFFQIPVVGPVDADMLEGWSALAFAAGRTNRIKLGTMVTGVTYRHPGVLVKTVTTLDVLSGGRAYFGVGAAWNEYEHRSLGVPFPPVAERFERLEETLRIARQMWADAGKQDDAQPFAGKHYQLERTLNVPQSVQRPHPPILVGGGGERKTLRLVAQYGDACNLFWRLGKDELNHKLDVLREHCAAVNRPYSDIEKTSLNHVRLPQSGAPDANALIEGFAAQAEMGFDHGLVSLANVSDPHVFEVWEERIVPAVSKLAVAGR
ncbi:MAG TPA: LLM class F420-dependent oxidoreductase [Ktedonobacterales bacterium]|nr:LLM class F420-dependent oxidoreductase [Ktedonobacterales bacterium]